MTRVADPAGWAIGPTLLRSPIQRFARNPRLQIAHATTAVSPGGNDTEFDVPGCVLTLDRGRWLIWGQCEVSGVATYLLVELRRGPRGPALVAGQQQGAGGGPNLGYANSRTGSSGGNYTGCAVAPYPLTVHHQQVIRMTCQPRETVNLVVGVSTFIAALRIDLRDG